MRNAAIFAASMLCATAVSAQVTVDVVYLRQEVEAPPVLSNLDPIPEDEGIAGAEVGLADNATTGRFMGQDWALEVVSVAPGGDFAAAAVQALGTSSLLIVDAPADALLTVADLPEAAGAILFNATAGDDRLRGTDCRANVLHALPSNAMRTDALAQFLVFRRWDETALVYGTHPDDIAYAEALRGSLEKFGLELSDEAEWAFDADMRRNASQEVPLFTQELRDHDILLIADEIHDFGRYIAYNTWEPRPVAGSEGLTAVAWAPVVEQWGAAQLQNRFEEHASRPMRPDDYGAWAAMRTIGEAVTRAGSAEAPALREYILSESFELAGFKGRPMSFRPWNGQLRQPIPLVTERAVVAMAPLEGFLHPTSELDTLGSDAPETTCTAFTE
ncbi:ABC transporter substrate-binding protein [Pontivivens ytuae]|uniref:ABC transporter substrate-binding protein n=1 Tax=Pontivivens ytuae TaxID=2789856 RepID=A0A7S9QDD1_9RHOB|nr:ABC transporter substrate-binding protein [Pontivivens ytuae]QPH54262.1 ABC transporter substrate-binding protein [Pontivivens ytuae]